MIELISYWKATCSPKVYVKPHFLNVEQIDWWKTLYLHGLGEFFYCNNIDDLTLDNFMEIYPIGQNPLYAQHYILDDRVLVPIGGGKDSIVTMELLKNASQPIIPMIINPRRATIGSVEIAGFTPIEIVEVQRTLDPQLLQLNEQGFFNGHTPFSAMLAFVTLLVAAGTRTKHIALSNESSSNEPTIKNLNINHQYSKSIEFERAFRIYVKQFISPDLNYFSLLRALNEITIAKLFARQSKYFSIFKSCNVGSKNDMWCCHCSKCLFTFNILSPFIIPKQLEEIFGKNLLDDPALTKEFDQLIGLENNKPFDCVGTVTETKAALRMTLAHYPDKRPYLLNRFEQIFASELSLICLPKDFLGEHFLTNRFDLILKSSLYEED